jgi:hypothetical protein
MMPSFLRLVLCAMLLWNIAAPLHAADQKTMKYRFNVPPSADLAYSIKSLQKGFSVEGDALVKWNAEGKTFSVANETRAMMLGKILDAKSEGVIDDYGLAPTSFTEKRFRKGATMTSFDREAGIIRFSESEQTTPLNPGEQDRNSAVWQLISIARAAQGKFKAGSEWRFWVAGQRDAQMWTFKVMKPEKISTPLGELHTLHVARVPAPDLHDQKLDIWLAPQHEWYPARLRFSEHDGDFIEQTLEKISKKTS